MLLRVFAFRGFRFGRVQNHFVSVVATVVYDRRNFVGIGHRIEATHVKRSKAAHDGLDESACKALVR